jgi:hypothetical protein
MSARAKIACLGLALAVCGLGAGFAEAEFAQHGNVRISVAGELRPNHLPRTGVAPVSVSISTKLTTRDGSVPPQLNVLRIELNRQGQMDTVGLPECHTAQIHPASTAQALTACRPALVGKGRFSVDVVLGNQQPYPTSGRLLVFNGRYRGRPALLGQIYSAHPFTNSFVIPFQISRRKDGPYGILLAARLPKAFTDWGHVTGLELRLFRRYSYRGHRHSFLSAGCPAPKGFRGAIFPLAGTSFSFNGGIILRSTLSGECKVAR